MIFFKVPRIVRSIFPFRTWDIKVEKPVVYLTFDDGPQPEITDWVLEYLQQENVVATFFCVGNNLLLHPEYTSRLVTLGHQVGNHTMQHEKGIRSSTNDYWNSVQKCKSLVSSCLFRPPYGRMTLRQSWKLKSTFRIIMWSWLSYDFDHSIPLDTIMNSVEQITKGDILVFHDNRKSADRLKVLLPKVIHRLKEKGFSFGIIPS